MSSSGCLGNATFLSSIRTPYKMINEADATPKQLNSLSSSLRRTLSADMSASHEGGLISSSSSMKRAHSSEHLDVLGEHDHDHKEVENHHEEKKLAFEDIWSSILSNKKNESGSNPAPYVHPLVKRRASSLSEKSLEVCTESLGSETGSDGFGSEEYQLPDPEPQSEVQDISVGNYNYNVEYETNKEYRVPPSSIAPATTKSMVRSASFPPPLPSLSDRNNLHMRSHRCDGRLVVEAVSVPSTSWLRADRRDGRLLLTLSADPGDRYNYRCSPCGDKIADENYPVQQAPLENHDHVYGDDNDDEVEDDDQNDHVEDEKVKEMAIGFVTGERASYKMIMSKVIGGKKWETRNFNATVIKNLDEEAEDEAAQPLLPPLNIPAPVSATTALNPYEYVWRRGNVNTAAVVVKDVNGNYNKWVLGRDGNKITAQAQIQTEARAQKKVVKEVVVGNGAAEYLVPFLRGCKEARSRRSLLLLEPYCIATS